MQICSDVCPFVCPRNLPTCRSSAVFRIRVDAAVVNSFVEFSLVDDGSPFEVPTLRLKRLLSPIYLASRIDQSRRGKSDHLRWLFVFFLQQNIRDSRDPVTFGILLATMLVAAK